MYLSSITAISKSITSEFYSPIPKTTHSIKSVHKTVTYHCSVKFFRVNWRQFRKRFRQKVINHLSIHNLLHETNVIIITRALTVVCVCANNSAKFYCYILKIKEKCAVLATHNILVCLKMHGFQVKYEILHYCLPCASNHYASMMAAGQALTSAQKP